MRMTTLRVFVLGDHKVGKSAVTVRFLTKRFIGEYYSDTDHVYRHTLRQEDSCIDVEICDTCSKACGSSSVLEEEGKLAQADAFVLVFSVCSRRSFLTATNLLRALARLRPISTSFSSASASSSSTSPALPPTLLLGNMTDLEHLRQVEEEEGRQVALSTGCLYYEVSAAESAQSVDEAFSAFLRMASSCVQHRSVLKRRRSSLGRRIGGLFSKAALGGGSSNNTNNNSSGSFSGSSKGIPSSSSYGVGKNLVSLGRNGINNAVENAKSFSIASGSNSSNNNISSRLKRGDANNNGSSKDKARDAGHSSGDPTDRKLASVVNRDKNSHSSSFSSTSSSSSSSTISCFPHSRSCASTGSDVYIADALRRRASLVANSNRPICPGDNCDKRKMSLPILPEEMPMKTLSECFEH